MRKEKIGFLNIPIAMQALSFSLRRSTSFLSLLLFLVACTSGVQQEEIKNPAYRLVLFSMLSKEHILAVHEVQNRTRLKLLDTRTAEEFQVSRLPGAQLLGFEPINKELLRSFELDDTLLVYCSIGYRSERVANELRAMGFKNVFNLYGGIFEWVNQGKPLENGKGEPTRQVHPYNFWWGFFLTEGHKTTTPL